MQVAILTSAPNKYIQSINTNAVHGEGQKRNGKQCLMNNYSDLLKKTKSFRSCLLCETVGIVYLNDIEFLPKKDKLYERLKKNPIVKRYQLQNYASKEKKILSETNSQGYVKSIIEYYVMGQNVTTMSVLETSDALLNRDASKFASILKTKVARCY